LGLAFAALDHLLRGDSSSRLFELAIGRCFVRMSPLRGSTFIHSDASFSASDIATALVRPRRGARMYCSIKNGIDFNPWTLSTPRCKSRS